MTQVVVFPRGQLTDKDRSFLRKSGVCVVEADDPSKVVVALPAAVSVHPDDLLLAAMDAMTEQTGLTAMRDRFVSRLNKLVQSRIAKELPK